MLALWYHTVLSLLFVMTCLLLILIVLLQKGRGGGLGAMFGGGGGGAFGARTGDVLTWVTIVLTGMFLLLAIGTTMAFRPTDTFVSVPKLSIIPPGKIGEVNNVVITTTTRGAKIWYQIDDKEAGIYRAGKADAADKAIAVPVGSRLTAWAVRKGWTPSDKVQAVYGVELFSPDDIEDVIDIDDIDTLEGPDSPVDDPTDDATDEAAPDDVTDETVPDDATDETVSDDVTDETAPDGATGPVTDAPE